MRLEPFRTGTATQDQLADDADNLGTVELELIKLVRHLETFGRKSSLYVRIDRAGYLALRTLDALGPSCVNALAQALHLDASTVTRQVAALETGGFVRRHTDPADRRSSLIELSAEGRRIMRKVEQGRREAIEKMLDGWNEGELGDLAIALSRLNLSLFQSVADQVDEQR
jgi:DNA-binding MarR family transcriptional regulator